MKSLALIAAAASLTGCVAYGVPYAETGVYYGQGAPYGVQPAAPVYYGQPAYGGRRDRDRDGVPNRYDRDRDGDGVPNRADARPNNPRRY
jgi:hypothetical protein